MAIVRFFFTHLASSTLLISVINNERSDSSASMKPELYYSNKKVDWCSQNNTQSKLATFLVGMKTGTCTWQCLLSTQAALVNPKFLLPRSMSFLP
jgi:hypothetical protein